jgi:hypothetical protein
LTETQVFYKNKDFQDSPTARALKSLLKSYGICGVFRRNSNLPFDNNKSSLQVKTLKIICSLSQDTMAVACIRVLVEARGCSGG